MLVALTLGCAGGPHSAVAPPTTGDTGASTLPVGGFAFSMLPWNPDVTDLALTGSGSMCVSGSEWIYGYGGAVDQYYPGEAVLNRVSADGVRDLAFAGDGEFEEAGSEGGTAVAAGPGDGCYLGFGWPDGDSHYAIPTASVILVDPTGAVDPSFVAPVLDHDDGDEAVLDLASLPDGGVLVLTAARYSVQVDRYDPDGALATTWGVGGEAALPLTVDCYATSDCGWGELEVLADGRVRAGFGQPAVVVGLDPTGGLDPGFGVAGVAASTGTFRVYGMALDPTGGLILGGIDGDRAPTVEGLDAVGAPALAPTRVGVGEELHGVAVDDQGRIYVAGRVDGPALLRLGSDGVLDPTWGTGGVVTFPPPTPGEQGEFDEVALRADGGPVVVGRQLRTERVVGLTLTP